MTVIWAVRAWRRAFWEERALPSGDLGPVDLVAFARLAARRWWEMGLGVVPHHHINEIKDSHRDSALGLNPKSEVLKKLGLKYGNPFSLSLHRGSLSAKRMEFQA
jgi:hypothetical protein